MAKDRSNHRIKIALHLNGWTFEEGSKTALEKGASRIMTSEYSSEMDGHIFCPVCFTNLNRIPKNKEHCSNGRDAYFAHKPKYKETKCNLRSIKPIGKRYETHEEAQKAIDDEQLVVVTGFLIDKPTRPTLTNAIYDETPVEDIDGSLSDIPISRHNGETFKLPSKISTVAGICRNFNGNLYKYYYFPGQKNAIRLVDLLRPIEAVENESTTQRLYYGVIKSSFNAGNTPKPENIRMTKLRCHEDIHDFYLKATEEISQDKGIDDNSKDRIVLMFGTVSRSGIGLCIEKLKWGEFALLPEKYNSLLI